MPDSPTRAKPRVTPRQLLLIGVLGAILAGVLIVQFSGGETGAPAASSPATPAPPPPRPAGPGAKPAAVLSTAETPARPGWPKVSGAEAAGYDPFALPRQVAGPSDRAKKESEAQAEKQQRAEQLRRQQEQALAALRRRGASTVFHSATGAAAIVGARTVRVGDELDGFRVVSIDADGVLLTPKPQNTREDQQ